MQHSSAISVDENMKNKIKHAIKRSGNDRLSGLGVTSTMRDGTVSRHGLFVQPAKFRRITQQLLAAIPGEAFRRPKMVKWWVNRREGLNISAEHWKYEQGRQHVLLTVFRKYKQRPRKHPPWRWYAIFFYVILRYRGVCLSDFSLMKCVVFRRKCLGVFKVRWMWFGGVTSKGLTHDFG